ncbi:MAG: hypothetical protein WC812_04575 [Candidatus Pacearchaeota archaeon]|jgi:hypothetical protein
MNICFDEKEFKSEKERNEYCYYHLKELKNKDKMSYSVWEYILIFGPLIICIIISFTTKLNGFFMLAIIYLFPMLLFYKSKTTRKIISYAKEYEKNYSKEIEKKKRMVQEYERKCKKCGKIWHSLKNEEDLLRKTSLLSGIAGVGTAIGGNLSASAQTNRNLQASANRLIDLQKCPKCGSQNYSEKITEFERK